MDIQTHRILHRRTKMVTFRVSFEEYEKFRIYCMSQGQRSVSELARNALTTLVDSGAGLDVRTRLTGLEHQLQLLSAELSRLGQAQEPTLESEERL